jgi:hypothetical protein
MIHFIHKILHNQEIIMTAIEDLNTAIATLTDTVAVEISALTTALSFVGQDAAIEASVAKLTALNTALKDSVTPAPVPTPAPTPTPVTPA